METQIKAAAAVGGAIVSFLFGGWSALLTILLAFVVMDYISGSEICIGMQLGN